MPGVAGGPEPTEIAVVRVAAEPRPEPTEVTWAHADPEAEAGIQNRG